MFRMRRNGVDQRWPVPSGVTVCIRASICGVLAKQPILEPLVGSKRDFCRFDLQIGDLDLEMIAFDRIAETMCSTPAGRCLEIKAMVSGDGKVVSGGRRIPNGELEAIAVNEPTDVTFSGKGKIVIE